MTEDMPPKMRRFLKRKRRAVDPARARPKGWLSDRLKKQSGRCYYCRRKMEMNPSPAKLGLKPTLDHVIPLSGGGENKLFNVVAACSDCNQAKGSMSEAEFRAALRARAA